MSSIRLVTTVDAENPDLHDLQLKDGQFVYVGFNEKDDLSDRIDMIRQRAMTALKLVRGEVIINQNEGLPFFEELTKKGITTTRIAAIYKKRLEEVVGIAKATIEEVSIDSTTRTAFISWSALTDSGDTITSQRLDVPAIVTSKEINR